MLRWQVGCHAHLFFARVVGLSTSFLRLMLQAFYPLIISPASGPFILHTNNVFKWEMMWGFCKRHVLICRTFPRVILQWVGSHLGQSTGPKGGACKDDGSGSGQGKAPSGQYVSAGPPWECEIAAHPEFRFCHPLKAATGIKWANYYMIGLIIII